MAQLRPRLRLVLRSSADASPPMLRPARSDELKRPSVGAELVPQPKTHGDGAPPPQRHQLSALLGPFAERAATLKAEAVAAAAGVRAAALARDQGSAAAAPKRGPRRALLQGTLDTEAVLIALLILLVDFFLGFYTGYLKGFFT